MSPDIEPASCEQADWAPTCVSLIPATSRNYVPGTAPATSVDIPAAATHPATQSWPDLPNTGAPLWQMIALGIVIIALGIIAIVWGQHIVANNRREDR